MICKGSHKKQKNILLQDKMMIKPRKVVGMEGKFLSVLGKNLLQKEEKGISLPAEMFNL